MRRRWPIQFRSEDSARPFFLEVIAPPVFANYFRELATIIPAQGMPDRGEFMALAGRYGLEFDFAAMGSRVERYHLRLG
jgi:hypothetical protein